MIKRYASVFIVILLLFLIPATLVSAVRNQMVQLVSPLTGALISKNKQLANTLRSLSQISTLRQDKQELQGQVLALQQELAQKEALGRENESLRKELGVTGIVRETPKVLAHAVIQGNNPLDPSVTIDVGSSQGVAVGQPVVSQGALIGKVIAVRKDSAVVRFITSKESRVQAWLVSNQEKGLLVGDGNSAYLTDITQGLAIAKDEVVETSGLGGSLPRGIVIGQVDSMVSKQSDLSQRFLIRLPQNPGTADPLFVLLTDIPE